MGFDLKDFLPQDCIGVIDGMHIPAHVPAKDQSRFRDKTGNLTQNVLAACTFDLQFVFIYPGWEGSVTDSHVLRAVLDAPDQNFPQIPEGFCFLLNCNIHAYLMPFYVFNIERGIVAQANITWLTQAIQIWKDLLLHFKELGII